jgi:hypothetical protein
MRIATYWRSPAIWIRESKTFYDKLQLERAHWMRTRSLFVRLANWRGARRKLGDDGTNALRVSEVLRMNELQVWRPSEHLVDGPLIRTKH